MTCCMHALKQVSSFTLYWMYSVLKQTNAMEYGFP